MSATVAVTVPVSVVIPAYNRAGLVERAIRSAQRQRPSAPAEVIVVDDCSDDETGAVAGRLGATVVRHEVNRGRSAARNTGIKAASHEWVAFLDSDDEWLPDHLARIWPRRHGHVVVASSALGSGPEGVSLIGPPSQRPVEIIRPRDLLVPQNAIALSGSLAERRALIAVGGFGIWDTAEDLDLWLRMLTEGSLLVCPEPGYLYHRHSGQVSNDLTGLHHDLLAMLDSHRDQPWWSPRLRESVEVTARWDALRASQWAGDRAGMRRNARWLLDRPRRVRDLVALWVWRRRVVRRLATVDPAAIAAAPRDGHSGA